MRFSPKIWISCVFFAILGVYGVPFGISRIDDEFLCLYPDVPPILPPVKTNLAYRFISFGQCILKSVADGGNTKDAAACCDVIGTF